ncbi:MAG: copper ion binding protein, partial [Candidatus Woesebacteria bacterium]|nr:copper ion binding protein [Candidatus Woesebacteria bacterium]
MNKILNLKIKGMHCTSCEKIITNELSLIKGTKNILIDSKTGSGRLTIVNNNVTDDQIINAIKNVGYDGTILNPLNKKKVASEKLTDSLIVKKGIDRINLSIKGMHCTSCAGLIERQIKKIDGVSEARVNFASEKASILYDLSICKSSDFINAVEKAGYSAVLDTEELSKNQSVRQKEEIKSQWKRFLI